MEVRLRLPKAGNTLDCRAPMDSWVKGSRAVCDARMDDPFGSPNRMPLNMEEVFVHGFEEPRNCLAQPESLR